AVSLPFVDYEQRKAEFFAAVDIHRTLVVYCSGYGCPDSFDLAVRLIEDGYRNVRLFEGGLPEWREAGLPVEGGGS
ncbi:MAG: rhodanese-like domain-containing protein, partial [Desulfuromonadales bacterium]|nr:rhodanese-like domain-containing protein [Desulfuromonadales bacterium]NIS42879.1 rhodanese-like domain-containing protein [Desulfuromonadales bacterium]